MLRISKECGAEVIGYERREYVEVSESADQAQQKLLTISTEKAKVSHEELTAYSASHTKLQNEKVRIEVTISALEKEIKRLKSIKDTCPTCGQHLPNVSKPSTTEQEQQLNELMAQLTVIKQDITKCNDQHQMYVSQINAAFDVEMSELNKIISETNEAQLLEVELTQSQLQEKQWQLLCNQQKL